MGTVNKAIATKSTELIASRLNNQVELYRGSSEEENEFFFILIKIGDKAFYMDVETLGEIAYEFTDIVSKKKKL